MVRKENIFRKKITLVLLLSILVGVCSHYSLAESVATNFQKIQLTPTALTWEVDVEDNNETSVFTINLDVTIINPNNYSLGITYPTLITQMIGTSAIIDLEDNTTATAFYCSCATFCLALDYRTINPGQTTNQSASKLTIFEDGVTTLPDGEYTFSAYLYNQNETKYVSNKVLLQMNNGVPTISYISIISVNLGIQRVVFPLAIITICTVYSLRRRNKK